MGAILMRQLGLNRANYPELSGVALVMGAYQPIPEGIMVTLDGSIIRPAVSGDDILGVISNDSSNLMLGSAIEGISHPVTILGLAQVRIDEAVVSGSYVTANDHGVATTSLEGGYYVTRILANYTDEQGYGLAEIFIRR